MFRYKRSLFALAAVGGLYAADQTLNYATFTRDIRTLYAGKLKHQLEKLARHTLTSDLLSNCYNKHLLNRSYIGMCYGKNRFCFEIEPASRASVAKITPLNF